MWAEVVRHRDTLTRTGEFVARRRDQQVQWMWAMLEERLMLSLKTNPAIKDRLLALEAGVAAGDVAASLAVEEIAAALGI